MKKLSVFAVACVLGSSLYATSGADIYKKCNACHGLNADMTYANKVPPLIKLSKEERLKSLMEYKAGTNNKYGMGAVMKAQLIKLNEQDLVSVNDYIESLK